MFWGRGHQCSIALKGALKFKKNAYMYAEAYPAGERKHGPRALCALLYR
ncbi:MAG: SIS domain-containing protein [Halomonas sp.]|nr:SIS domain-containing protein [Halomonas sp.]MDN6315600.1 SIS domain-containing protein [Halomonas sp.]